MQRGLEGSRARAPLSDHGLELAVIEQAAEVGFGDCASECTKREDRGEIQERSRHRSHRRAPAHRPIDFARTVRPNTWQ